jgi:pilus assembly protein CpaB
MTMQRRTTGVIAAVVLALLGTFGLVTYVESAKDDAVAGERLVNVYVATGRIDAGTSGADIKDHVKREEVPAKVRAKGAVTDLKGLADSVASVDIVEGEQLVKSRFVAPGTPLGRTSKGVPAGYFGSTVSLDPEQALGGQVRAGDKVAVVGVLDDVPGPNDQAQNTATVIARDVLVTAVQIDGSKGANVEKKNVTDAPTGKFLVTLALNQHDLESTVAYVNGGKVWLAADTGAQ